VHKIDMLDQPANILTKAIPQAMFEKHWRFMMGW
jgi:hypothetical protein